MRKPPTPDKSNERLETVLYSPILYRGSVNVTERAGISRAGPLSGTRLKAVIFPLLHKLVRYTPVPLAMLPVRLVITIALGSYLWPGNRLRKACETISKLASKDAKPRTAWSIYRNWLNNSLGTIENFFMLYRHGADSVLPRIRMKQDDIEQIHTLTQQHGGIILAVPHNLGSAFSALLIGHHFDMLLVAKNSPTIERTRVAIDFYERMNLKLLMVRGGNIFEISRVLYSVLRKQQLVAATLDNIDRTDTCETVELFGQPVGLSVWAAKIATKMQVPVVPAYFSSTGKHIDVHVGSAIVSDNIHACIKHYAHFFEAEILKDPASWAYLADKHWQKILDHAGHAGD